MEKNYELITSVAGLERECDRLSQSDGPIGFDIETGYIGPDRDKASVRPELAMVVGISFTDSPTRARYVPLAHDAGENVDNYQAARLLWPVLHSGRGVAHNAPFELRHLSRWFLRLLADDPDYGEQVRATRGYFPIRSDTQVETYVAADLQFFGLKYVTWVMFDRQGQVVPVEEWNRRAKTIAELVQRAKDQAKAIAEANGETKVDPKVIEACQRRLEADFDGHKMTDLHELFTDLPVNKRKSLRFNILDQHDTKVYRYACEDSAWALAIHQYYFERVSDIGLYHVEMGIVRECIPAMEDHGVKYDWPAMRRHADELRVFRDHYNAEIQRELADMIGEPVAVNLASPAQVGKLLFEQLGFRTPVYTATSRDLPAGERKMSTGKIALAGLAKKYPVVQKIRNWKEMTRLLGTYLEKYEKLYQWADDGMTHPNHMSAIIVTGRFAVSDPPYQQSPKVYHFDLADAKDAHARHAEAHGDKCACDDPAYAPPAGSCFRLNFRDMIVAPEDHYILGFDLSQAELRAIAGMAQEPELLRAFAEGRDVHTLTASLMLKIPIDQVTKKQRDIGKAQPVDELVLTPTGWRAIGSLGVGDYVIARDGTPTRVTGVFPQGLRQVYKINTVDGGSVRASDEHWWEIHPLGQKPRLMTTAELAKEPMRRGLQYRWFLPRIEPAQTVGGPHPIDPYVLGLLIGDGSFTTPTPAFTSADQELVDAVAAGLPIGCKLTISPRPDRCPTYRIVHEAGHPNRMMTFLRHLGLAGKTAHHKFVPPAYLYGDVVTRHAVLQGLLDSDGSNNGSKGVEFTSASRQLCSDVQELIRSLGGRANMYYKPGANAWRLWGRLPAGFPPFRLRRKLDRMTPENGVVNRAIHSVEEDGFAECVCIAVEDPERLYITRDYIPTHNTLNFALLYGMGVKSLADRLGIPVDEAQELYDAYFSAYSRIAAWVEKQVEFARDHGYVVSKFGRRLPIWEYQSDKHWIRAKGDRAAVNYPVQGSATGDFVKIAMVQAQRALRDKGIADKVHLVMNVHDALEFYVHRSLEPQDVIAVLQPAVIFPVAGWPPMKADWHFGKRWGSPIEIEVTDDGRYLVKGQIEYELRPGTEVDADTGEEVEVLPEVDRRVLHQALGREVDEEEMTELEFDTGSAAGTPVRVVGGDAEPSTVGRRLIVEIVDMPTEPAFRDFLTLLASRPGEHMVTLRTPQGDLDLDVRTGVDTSYLSQMYLVLGEVRLYYHADDIDAHDLLDGITL